MGVVIVQATTGETLMDRVNGSFLHARVWELCKWFCEEINSQQYFWWQFLSHLQLLTTKHFCMT